MNLERERLKFSELDIEYKISSQSKPKPLSKDPGTLN